MSNVTPFGTTSGGKAVARIALASEQLQVGLLTYGAALQSVRLAGVGHDLTLGSDDLADYQGQMRYHGTLIGPIANRLTGAVARLGDRTLRFPPNEGANLLHSGPRGMQTRVWDLTQVSSDSVTLELRLQDGDTGPGNRHITACWTVTGSTLRLDLTGTSDAPGLMNLANHSYWNLDGTSVWTGHRLDLTGTGLVLTDPEGLPTGQVGPLPDLTGLAPGKPPLDHCLTLAPAPRPLARAARLTGASGISLDLWTTETGLQVYDGRAAIRPGRSRYEGIALEAQGWPDAPNHAAFPSIGIGPDRPYRQTTEWRLAAP